MKASLLTNEVDVFNLTKGITYLWMASATFNTFGVEPYISYIISAETASCHECIIGNNRGTFRNIS